jgi:hypothetical protein
MVTLEEMKEFHWLSPRRQKTLFLLLTGKITPLAFKSARELARHCYNYPDNQYLLETAVNECIEGFGTEAIRLQDQWLDSYHGDIFAGYVNQGDTYAVTIVWDYRNYNEPFVTSWGDWLEELERSEGIESCPYCGVYNDINREDLRCESCGRLPEWNEHFEIKNSNEEEEEDDGNQKD